MPTLDSATVRGRVTSRTLRVREVGPREGFQCVPDVASTDLKLQILDLLKASGVRRMNAVALVHPKAMPQMADAEDLLERFGPQPDIEVSALAPNRRGIERAVVLAKDDLLDEALLIHASTKAVLEANGITLSSSDHLKEVVDLGHLAQENGMAVTTFISAAFGCSVEGMVDPSHVVEIAAQILESQSATEISISDSTGQADPLQVFDMMERLAPVVGDFPITLHLHDSRGAGLANALAAVMSPIENLTLDSAFGGLGGDIPFLPEAAGNIATEDLCEMLNGIGVDTGVDIEPIIAASKLLEAETDRQLHSQVVVNGSVGWKYPS